MSDSYDWVPVTPADDFAAEQERLAWIATCTSDELALMLPWMATDPLGFDEQRARVEAMRAGAAS